MSAAESQPDAAPWTIGRLLNWTTDFFTQHGIDSPRLDAEVLLADCRGCQRIMLYTAFHEPATEELREAFRHLVRKRAQGTPVAYLVGKREFYSLEFEVTPDVLIPRPETELLVIALLDHVKEQGRHVKEQSRGGESLQLADLGTGSGILAICAAKELPHAAVTAVDISPAALKVAQRNAERLQVAERITFYESDLFDAVPADQQFDFLLSNPPYITSEEMTTLDATVRDYEPHLALDGGPEGTEVIQRILTVAPQRLRPGGILLVEISPQIAPRCEALLAASDLQPLPTLPDLAGRPRILQARQPST